MSKTGSVVEQTQTNTDSQYLQANANKHRLSVPPNERKQSLTLKKDGHEREERQS